MKQKIFTSTLSLFALAFSASSAFASADCPKNDEKEWIPEAEMRKRIEAQGYVIDKFKIDGNCYEIYGKEGNDKVEIYFNTKSGKIVKKEVH